MDAKDQERVSQLLDSLEPSKPDPDSEAREIVKEQDVLFNRLSNPQLRLVTTVISQ